MITIQQCHRAARALTDQVLSPLLFIGGYVVAVLSIAVAIKSGVMVGFAVLCCGIGAVAIARIIELLHAIEADLAVIRARVDAGVLGLLRM
jgi:hypothetical protein